MISLRLGIVCQPGTNALIKRLLSLRIVLDDRVAWNETVSIEGDSRPVGFHSGPNLPSGVEAQTAIEPVGTAGSRVVGAAVRSSDTTAVLLLSIRRRRQHLTDARDCCTVSQFWRRRCAVHRKLNQTDLEEMENDIDRGGGGGRLNDDKVV